MNATTRPGALGVVGGGLMGAGIAQASAIAGWRVAIREADTTGRDACLERLDAAFDRARAKGKSAPDALTDARERIEVTTTIDSLAGCDLVVEAVPESLELKRRVFAELGSVCTEDAVLATNTSAIPITHIAAATPHPERVVGTHFFAPVMAMGLCEVVRGYRTSDDTIGRALDFVRSLGKRSIVVQRDVAGFVASRLISVLANEAARLVETGVATAEDIDLACELGLGHAMCPLRTIDLTGIDVMVRATTTIYDAGKEEQFAPVQLLQNMVSAGALGRKTGSGFYRYG